jgi:cytochrome c biogenesis protein CcmG/thiol:disulfide interchange protein DsbE
MSDTVASGPAARGRTAVWVVLPVAVVLSLLLVLLATRDPSSERETRSDLLGHLAPDVTGTTTDGDVFAIDAERGRWVVVNFFSTTCVPCIQEHPELVAFQRRHAAAGDATVVSVAFDDSAANVARFFEENGGDWPVLVADTGAIAVRFGVTGVPESYLVAPSGVVVSKFIGGVRADDLEARIDQLVAGA